MAAMMGSLLFDMPAMGSVPGSGPVEIAPTCGSERWRAMQHAAKRHCTDACASDDATCEDACPILDTYFASCSVSLGVVGESKGRWVALPGGASRVSVDTPAGNVVEASFVLAASAMRLGRLRIRRGPACGSEAWTHVAALAANRCRAEAKRSDAAVSEMCDVYLQALRTCRGPDGSELGRLPRWGLRDGELTLMISGSPEGPAALWMRFKRKHDAWRAVEFDYGLGC